MEMRDRTQGAANLILGLLGTVCLLAIVPIKVLRFWGHPSASLAVDVAPSLLGSSGLLFLLLSSTGWLARLKVPQVVLLAGVTSFGLELAQLIPRPGPLARIRYSFDCYDLVASAVGLGVAYVVSILVLRRPSSAGAARLSRGTSS